jgi:hypothetical protein
MSLSLFDDVFTTIADCLTPEAARRIANLRANAVTQSRRDALADKANEGTLSPDEMAEYDQFLAAWHVITILQAKARSIVESSGRPSSL